MHIAELITKSETARYKRKFNRRTLGKREKNMVLFIEILLIGVGLSMDAFAAVSYTHLTLPTILRV